MDKQALLSDTQGHYGSLYSEPLPASTAAAFPEVPQDEEWASAPPADMLDDVVGYEGTIAGGEGSFVLPPISIAEATRRSEPSPQRAWSIPTITEDMAREAFIQFASSKCCYSTKPAKEMVFRDLQAHNTYRYRLESFTESRSTEWKMVPYNGQFVDSSAYGMAPLPWDIIVERPPMFQNDVSKVQVPHTSSTKGCPTCMTLGRIACTECTATGKINTKEIRIEKYLNGIELKEEREEILLEHKHWNISVTLNCYAVKCWVCKGRGYQFNDDRCSRCNGTGLQCCDKCSGNGTKTCKTCKGSGQLMVFIQLTVKWKNNIFERIADRQSGLPIEIFNKINGQNIFTDQQFRVNPIFAFPDSQVNLASQKAIQEHEVQLARTSHIIQQRQMIEFIPITQVYYSWKEEEYSYFTCGVENRVYAPDYPAKCCCSIL